MSHSSTKSSLTSPGKDVSLVYNHEFETSEGNFNIKTGDESIDLAAIIKKKFFDFSATSQMRCRYQVIVGQLFSLS